MSTSGMAMLAARFAIPDLGLAGLGEMADGTRELLAATQLPCLCDGDDGYGGLKSVVRTVRVNEQMGAGALVLEDQGREAKRPGQSKAVSVVPEEEIDAKIKAAVQTRDSADFWIFGRTDAYGTSGLDAALRRGHRFLNSGADGVFLAGIRTPEDLRTVGEEFRGVPLMAVMYGRPGWPWLTISELHALGFTQIAYPLATILPACAVISEILQDMKEAMDGGSAPRRFEDAERSLAILHDATGTASWQALSASEKPLSPAAHAGETLDSAQRAEPGG